MGQKMLTDEQIATLVGNPNVTEDDLRLLSPSERKVYDDAKRAQSFTGRVSDVATGALKGAGDTAFALGNLVHKTPLLGQLTDALAKAVGPAGTDPNASFAASPEQLKTTNTAQDIGKTLEQVGEFFIPAGPARAAAIEKITSLLPNAMKNPKLLNKLAAIAGRTVGEAGSAGAVSALHGNENPQTEAEMAGVGPLAGAGLEETYKALMGTPWGRKLLPIMAASSVMGAAGHTFGPTGLGATMGLYGLTRKSIADALTQPGRVNRMAQTGRRVLEQGARGAAAVQDQKAARRRLDEQP